MSARFEFALLPRLFPAEHYKCSSWQEFVDRTRINPYLHLPGIGIKILKLGDNVARRKFNRVECPFNASLLDSKNNLAHLWLTFAYLLDPNDPSCFNIHRTKSEYDCLTIANILDKDYLAKNQEYRNNLRPVMDEFITVSSLANLIIDYVENYYTRLVNAMFQLEIYLKFLILNSRCDRISFSPYGFSFEPHTILFYLTQVSGFQRHSLSILVKMNHKMKLLIGNYIDYKFPIPSYSTLRDKYLEAMGDDVLVTDYIVWDITLPTPHYKYQDAVGREEDEILDRNKEKLKKSGLVDDDENDIVIQLAKKAKKNRFS